MLKQITKKRLISEMLFINKNIDSVVNFRTDVRNLNIIYNKLLK